MKIGRFQKNEIRLLSGYYLMLILIDSTMYSAFTMMILSYFSNQLKLLILGIESLVAIFIFIDTNRKKKMLVGLKLQDYIYLGEFGLILFLCFPNSIFIKCFSYAIVTLSTSLLVLDISKSIIIQQSQFEIGFMKLANLKTFATLIGFGIGGILNAQFIPSLIILIMIVFAVSLILVNRFSKVDSHKSLTISIGKIEDIFTVFVLGILTANTSVWVPIVAVSLQHQYVHLTVIAFVLPGVLTLILMRWLIKLPTVIILILFVVQSLIMIIGFINQSAIVQTFCLAFIVPTSLSISVHLRSQFFKKNTIFDLKSLIQLLSVNSNTVLFVLAILSIIVPNVGIYLLLVNMVSMIILVIKSQKEKL